MEISIPYHNKIFKKISLYFRTNWIIFIIIFRMN